MAPSKPKPRGDFQQKINDDRRRKAAQDLAQSMLGSGSRARSATPKQPGAAASASSQTLAGRAGVTKHRAAPAPIPRPGGSDLRIRGRASTCAVIARNFAPGTTEKDIFDTFNPLAGTKISSCKLVSAHPMITAEMLVPDREIAERLVARFDGQIADHRELRVYVKTGAPDKIHDPDPVAAEAPPPVGPRAQASTGRGSEGMGSVASQQARSDGRPPSVQDGRYGFAEPAQQVDYRPGYAQSGSNAYYFDNQGYEARTNHDNERHRERYDDDRSALHGGSPARGPRSRGYGGRSSYRGGRSNSDW